MSDDLVTFLRARFDEDEEVAQEASHPGAYAEGALYVVDDDFRHDVVRISSARVQREVEAKRRMLEMHAPTDDDPGGPAYCPECERYDGTGKPCPTVLLLTLPYSDHPDFDQEWVA